MRQGASFDLVALDRTARSVLDDADAEAEPARRAQHDSRSTSSTSSPAPPENEESDFFVAGNDSQSSLGVPNLQDMQVADDACLSPFNRLPNEILIAIFARLSSPADLLRIMKVCKRWARNAVEILWHRPSCTTWEKHERICRTLALEHPYFSYRDFVKRLNLSALAAKVNDGSVMPLAACTRVERLTLTGCSNLTDLGLIALVSNNSHLYSLDVSLGSSSSSSSEVVFHDHITEASIDAISANCPRLQGLNVSGCHRIANESFIQLAHSCRYIKRLKLNNCPQLSDDAVLAFAEHCPNILELDLNQCRQLTNEPVTALFTKARALREFRLAGCDLIDDAAFLSLPPGRRFEHLRILDLSSCTRLTDRAVEKITEAAPRLRNLVLQKCRNLTDASVYAISRLGKNLHYLHLGHCSLITDEAVKHLVSSCNRMRYIDLGCCTRLTDDSVTKLAALPKLKRIGLVKCASITDASVIALANANRRPRLRKDSFGNMIPGEYSSSQSCLERVHLSYCTNLTQESIIRLLNSCPRLTHLSLTGVQAFLRDDLEDFSRDAPPEFTEHQRSVFCVFSGQGVVGLRRHLNQLRQAQLPPRDGPHADETIFPDMPVATAGFSHLQTNEGGFDDPEADAIDEDDGLEDGSEMVIDPQPLLNNQNPAIPPPPPTQSMPQDSEPVSPTNPIPYVSGHPPYIPHRVVPPTTQPPTLQAPQPEASTSQESASANPNDPFAYVSGHPSPIPPRAGSSSRQPPVSQDLRPTISTDHSSIPQEYSPVSPDDPFAYVSGHPPYIPRRVPIPDKLVPLPAPPAQPPSAPRATSPEHEQGDDDLAVSPTDPFAYVSGHPPYIPRRVPIPDKIVPLPALPEQPPPESQAASSAQDVEDDDPVSPDDPFAYVSGHPPYVPRRIPIPDKIVPLPKPPEQPPPESREPPEPQEEDDLAVSPTDPFAYVSGHPPYIPRRVPIPDKIVPLPKPPASPEPKESPESQEEDDLTVSPTDPFAYVSGHPPYIPRRVPIPDKIVPLPKPPTSPEPKESPESQEEDDLTVSPTDPFAYVSGHPPYIPRRVPIPDKIVPLRTSTPPAQPHPAEQASQQQEDDDLTVSPDDPFAYVSGHPPYIPRRVPIPDKIVPLRTSTPPSQESSTPRATSPQQKDDDLTVSPTDPFAYVSGHPPYIPRRVPIPEKIVPLRRSTPSPQESSAAQAKSSPQGDEDLTVSPTDPFAYVSGHPPYVPRRVPMPANAVPRAAQSNVVRLNMPIPPRRGAAAGQQGSNHRGDAASEGASSQPGTESNLQ